jgi:hypothetical protein
MRITNYPNLKIDPLKENAGVLLKWVTKRLTMPYWISAGTALGLYRDGDFIKGDTDIDIAMKGYEGVERDVEKCLRKNWFRKGYEIVRTIWDGGRPMQFAFMIDGTIIDVYFHWQDGFGRLENHSESGWTRMRKEICLKPQWIKTKYGRLPIPKEEYFEIRYGKDWRTPQDKKAIFYEI